MGSRAEQRGRNALDSAVLRGRRVRDGLRALAGELATDGRPYRPHLTLARARHGGDPRPAATMLAAYDGPGWRAAEVVLFRSHLGPNPVHEPLVRWPLT